MVRYRLGLTMLVVLLTVQAAPQAWSAGFPQTPQVGELPGRPGGPPRMNERSPRPPAASWNRLPRVAPPPVRASGPMIGADPTPNQPVNGTWRQEGRYPAPNLYGRETRSPGAPAIQVPRNVPNRAEAIDGAVHGRLLNQGRPLVNCRVAMVPLTKKGRGYTIDGKGKPASTATDERGRYYFDHLPPGAYKLFWLPERRNRWIRRIEIRPDVTVLPYQTKQIKDIRTAMKTVN